MTGLTLKIIGEGKCKYQILQKAPYLGVKSSNISKIKKWDGMPAKTDFIQHRTAGFRALRKETRR